MIWHGKGSEEFSSHTVILLHACCVLYCSGSSLLKAKTVSGYTPLDLATTEEMCMVLSRDSLDISLSQGKAVKHHLVIMFVFLGGEILKFSVS